MPADWENKLQQTEDDSRKMEELQEELRIQRQKSQDQKLQLKEAEENLKKEELRIQQNAKNTAT